MGRFPAPLLPPPPAAGEGLGQPRSPGGAQPRAPAPPARRAPGNGRSHAARIWRPIPLGYADGLGTTHRALLVPNSISDLVAITISV